MKTQRTNSADSRENRVLSTTLGARDQRFDLDPPPPPSSNPLSVFQFAHDPLEKRALL